MSFDSEKFDYEVMDAEERPFAKRLVMWIASRMPGKAIDLGAGTGVYVEELRRLGITAQGYDIANPQPFPDLVQTMSMLNVHNPADVVLCLEVAEHIEKKLSNKVIESIWNNTKPGGYVIFSAAQPGQGGVGHINCQLPGYWREIAWDQGFVPAQDLENNLHAWITSGYHMGWFANNRQVWHRPK